MLPLDVAEELAKLQDRVPPFPGEQAVAMVERAFGAKIDVLSCQLRHRRRWPAPRSRRCTFAVLRGGREVAVKVLRPGRAGVDRERPVRLLHTLARLGRAAVGSMPSG